jgi:hypothetical protein
VYEVKDPFWQFVDHWQTLIAALTAGVLALLAAAGTVWVTIAGANRQVKAAREAADRQVAAAREQTKAAQHQTEVARELERRRLAREGYAFYAMLEAAMGAVIEDVEATRKLWPSLPTDHHSPQAYAARQRVKRAGFAELRGAFLRFGGPLTEPFLRLDNEIDDYSSQWITSVVNPVSSATHNIGVSAGVYPQLDSIERQAMTLRQKAADVMKVCRDELAKELELP